MIEFIFGAIVTAFILTLIWLIVTVIYLKQKLDKYTDELKDRKHYESNFHRDIYSIIDEVERRFDRRLENFEDRFTELDVDKSK
jgi:hypothetical protein